MKAASWKMRMIAAGTAAFVGLGGALVAVPESSGAASTKIVVGKNVPASAMSTHIGVTKNTVTVANIATHTITLFSGAEVGTRAYFDYINSKGGVNGRKIMVTAQNTKLKGTLFAAYTQAAVKNDFAMVGSFSVVATSGGQVVKQNPGFPDVSVTVTPANNGLPNLVSPVPLQGGWQEGSLLYFKKVNPKGALKAGAMVADETSAIQAWKGQEATMKHLGYNIIYDNTFSVTSQYATFVTDVDAMKSAGVQMLFIEQNPPLYAAPLIKALTSQDFHPMVVLGASTYSDTLIAKSGSPKATNGFYLEQNLSLYLGQDKKAIPVVTTFLKWVNKAKSEVSGLKSTWTPDLFTMYGWLSAQLFSQALKKAGKNPSRGGLLKALGKITTFSGTNIQIPVNPAAKTISNCYLLGRIKNGKWTRLADPPINSKTHGYRCTNQYYVPPGTNY